MVNYRDKSGKGQPAFSEKGKVVGIFIDGYLKKNVRRSKHMLQKPPAWCWDEETISHAEELGIEKTEIHEIEEGKTYIASIRDFRENGFSVQRGFGNQLGLTLAHWKIDSQDDDKQLTFEF
jgi:hypothetical protein